jgi:type I restriction enzyme S subunit
MKEQYKNTPIGKIPQSWEAIDLEKLVVQKGGLKRGPFGGAIKKEFFVPSGYKVYEQKNAIYKDLSIGTYYVDEEKFEELKGFEVLPKDLIVSCSGTIGRIKEIDENAEKGIINQALLRIRLNNEVILNKFFLNIFESDKIQNKIIDSTQGGAMKNLIGMKEFRKTKFPLPPLSEQQKIASILSTVDEKIENIDRQIEQAQNLKKGLMQRLLTRGIGHTRFKSSPLGEIPESWEVQQIGPYIDLLSGYPFKSKYFNDTQNGVKLLRGVNITRGNLRWSKDIDRYWNYSLEDLDKYYVQENDLVIGMDGSLVGRNYAKVQKDDLPLILVQRVARIRTNNELNREYLKQLIGSDYFINYVDEVKTSSGIPHISAKQIKEFKIPFPPLMEQQKIASILSTADEKLENLQSKKSQYEQLKKGLMQKLLTGKIRVKVN